MRIAVVGATGLVGETLLKLLGRAPWTDHEILPFATDRGRGGRKVRCGERTLTVQPTHEQAPEVDAAIFAVPNDVSRTLVPAWTGAGVKVIDKSSVWRMDPSVPLVVPEVNGDQIDRANHLIATPNCSTTQLAVALAPLHRTFGLRDVSVTTFQSVSGAGADGLAAWMTELDGGHPVSTPFPQHIHGNVIPQIGSVDEDGYSTEERKLMFELPKILGLADLPLSATAARVPVAVGHAEAVEVRLDREVTLEQVFTCLEAAPGMTVMRDPLKAPTPQESKGRDDVLVGRVRLHPRDRARVLLWVVSDNLRKGAATNALQILERWLGLVKA